MKYNDLREILDRPIAFYPYLARLVGSAVGGIILSQAWYWQRTMDEKPKRKQGDWWYKTIESWCKETTLTKNEFLTGRKACSKYLDYQVKGVPAIGYYRINPDADFPANLIAGIRQTGSPETGELEARNPANYSTETTAESTAENTTTAPETGASRALASRKKRAEPTPEARELVHLFAQAYLAHTGTTYGVREVDSKHATVLLAMSKMGGGEITDVVKRLWAGKGWWGKRTVTLKALVDHWNEIQAEVALGPVSEVPPHVEARRLREKLARHPANREWIGYRAESVTQAQREEYRALKAKLAKLEEQEQ